MLIFRHSIVDTSPFLPDMGEKTAFSVAVDVDVMT